MKDFIVVTMGGERIAIHTKHIIAMIQKKNDGASGTHIHVLEMDEPFYSTKRVDEILNEINAEY